MSLDYCSCSHVHVSQCTYTYTYYYPVAVHAQSNQVIGFVSLSVSQLYKKYWNPSYAHIKNVFTSLPMCRFWPHGSFSGVLAIPKFISPTTIANYIQIRMEWWSDNYGEYAYVHGIAVHHIQMRISLRWPNSPRGTYSLSTLVETMQYCICTCTYHALHRMSCSDIPHREKQPWIRTSTGLTESVFIPCGHRSHVAKVRVTP